MSTNSTSLGTEVRTIVRGAYGFFIEQATMLFLGAGVVSILMIVIAPAAAGTWLVALSLGSGIGGAAIALYRRRRLPRKALNVRAHNVK